MLRSRSHRDGRWGRRRDGLWKFLGLDWVAKKIGLTPSDVQLEFEKAARDAARKAGQKLQDMANGTAPAANDPFAGVPVLAGQSPLVLAALVAVAVIAFKEN